MTMQSLLKSEHPPDTYFGIMPLLLRLVVMTGAVLVGYAPGGIAGAIVGVFLATILTDLAVRPQRSLVQSREWFLIIGIGGGVCAGIGLASLLHSRAGIDATVELTAFSEHFIAGDVQHAYDTLLAAMRVARGDKKVFDASLDFVRKAGKNSTLKPYCLPRTFISALPTWSRSFQ